MDDELQPTTHYIAFMALIHENLSYRGSKLFIIRLQLDHIEKSNNAIKAHSNRAKNRRKKKRPLWSNINKIIRDRQFHIMCLPRIGA